MAWAAMRLGRPEEEGKSAGLTISKSLANPAASVADKVCDMALLEG